MERQEEIGVIGGSKGRGRGPSALHGGPTYFNFTQFLGKFAKIVCWRPLEGWPTLGKWRFQDYPLGEEALFPGQNTHLSLSSKKRQFNGYEKKLFNILR